MSIHKTKTLLKIVTLLALSVGAVAAAPITYNINFTTTGGNAPSSGGFVYDSSAALGSRFSIFIVQFGIYTIDFTSAANTNATPSGSGCGTTGDLAAAVMFQTGPCKSPNVYSWFFSYSPGNFDSVSFKDQGQGGSYLVGFLNADSGTGTPFGGTGSFSVSATPEPSSILLVLPALVAMIVRARRTI